jgi:hypothetical protein
VLNVVSGFIQDHARWQVYHLKMRLDSVEIVPFQRRKQPVRTMR